jgi:hypothetical protein
MGKGGPAAQGRILFSLSLRHDFAALDLPRSSRAKRLKACALTTLVPQTEAHEE